MPSNEIKPHSPLIRTFTVTDSATGEVLLHKVARATENGKDWCIMYRATAAEFAAGRVSYTGLRVFMHFTAYQDWRGFYATTRADLAKALHISRVTLNRALNELKSLDIIREAKQNGVTSFYINPDALTQGRDRYARIEQFQAIEPTTPKTAQIFQIKQNSTTTPATPEQSTFADEGAHAEEPHHADKSADMQTTCRQALPQTAPQRQS